MSAPLTRRAVASSLWAAPVIAAAAAAPSAVASTAPPTFRTRVTSVEYTRFTAASFRDEQINVNRPLAITIVGQIATGELIQLTVAGTMARSGSGDSRTTPLRISATDGVNFSVVSSSANADGTQVLFLRANRDLVEGRYDKTISWVPLEGRTTEQTQDLILTWPLGTYTAPIHVTIAGVSGSDQAYTLNREPVGGAPEN